MIMEYCDLGNLYNFQAQKPKKIFELNEAKKYLADTLDGLKDLHSNKMSSIEILNLRIFC